VKNALIDRLQRAALDVVDRDAGRRILDFGCGTGRLTDWLRARGAEVLGVDASPEMVEAARTRRPSGRFEVLESGRIPAEDGAFDTVLSVGVLQYFVMEASQLATISSELARVLAPGGQLVAIEQVQYGELERGGSLGAYRSGLAAAGLRSRASAVRVSHSRIVGHARRLRWIARLPGLERLVRLEA
jgi:SAM-dependent methyltransferase